MTSEVEEAVARLRAARNRLVDAQGEEVEAMVALKEAAARELGLVQGETRVRNRDGEWLFHMVGNFAADRNPWLTGHLIRKDGTPGKQLRTIYTPWEIVEEAPDA